jgi:hypothetical protein
MNGSVYEQEGSDSRNVNIVIEMVLLIISLFRKPAELQYMVQLKIFLDISYKSIQ